jgi:gamma-glutamylputrescine oxidase
MLNFDRLSYWEKNEFITDIDFLIIGTGIVACSTAFHLRKKHPTSKIVLLERSYLPCGASTKNAGFSCFGSATELLADLEKMPENEVWGTVSKRWEGLSYLREIIGDDSLDFQNNGSWDLIRNDESVLQQETHDKLNYLNAEIEKITHQKEVYSWDTSLNDTFGFEKIKGGFFNALEGQIDTGKMMQKWFLVLTQLHVKFLFSTEALSFENMQSEVLIETNRGELKAKKVFICVNGFAKNFYPDLDVEPARAQVLITKPISNLKIKGTFHYQEGFYYFRNIHNRILLGGGRNLNFKAENTQEIETSEEIQDALRKMLHKVILPKTSFEIDYAWAGIMGVGESKKPIVEEVKPNIYLGVRMGGMGVAIGSLIGRELADLV